MKYKNCFAPQSCATINASSSQNISTKINYKILKFDKINWSCFLALFVQKQWSISDVPGEDGSFLFVLVKGYEQDGDTLQNIFKQQESRWYYLLGRLTYFWQQITFFSISEMPLLRYHLIVFVLATVSFCILLNFLFVVFFFFLLKTKILWDITREDSKNY